MSRSLLPLVWLLLALSAPATLAEEQHPKPLEAEGIENLFQVSDRVLSGGQPEGEAAFKALKELGVTTILSVDGTPPDVEMARRFGIRYIHLPIGYDGIPRRRQAEMAKAAGEKGAIGEKGKIFVHCHHGKHRGPAAAAVLCLAGGEWSPDQAAKWMQAAGTSLTYRGLWKTILDYEPPTAEELAALPEAFPESVPPPEMVETMIALDQAFERLSRHAKSEDPPNDELRNQWSDDSVQLMELAREWLRADEVATRPEDFRSEAADFLKATEQLQSLAEKTDKPAALRDAVKRIEQRCAACHAAFRN
jgi:cytochrome c556